MAQSVEERKCERFALKIWQPIHFALEKLADIRPRVVRHGATLQPGARLRFDINLEAILRPRISRAPAHSINGASPRDCNQPTERFAKPGRVTPGFSPDLQNALLQHIFRFRFILQNLIDYLLQGLPMAFAQRSNGSRLTLCDFAHDRFILSAVIEPKSIYFWLNHGGKFAAQTICNNWGRPSRPPRVKT